MTVAELPSAPAASTPAPAPEAYDFDSNPFDSPSVPVPASAARHDATSSTDAAPQSGRARDEAGRFLPAEPATPPPTAAPAAPPAPKHSARVLRRAAEAGISQETIARLEPDALRDLTDDLFDRRFEEATHNFRIAGIHDAVNGGGADGTPAPAAPRSGPAPVAPAAAPAEADLGIDEGDFDPGLIGVIKKLHGEVTALKAQLATVQQAEAGRRAETFAQTMDRLFSKNTEFFGVGTVREVPRGSAHALRRQAVIDVMRNIPGSIEDRFHKANEVLGLGAVPATPPATPPAAPAATPAITREQWSDAALTRPATRSDAPEPKGLAAAKKAFLKGVREHGLDQEGEAGGSDDEF